MAAPPALATPGAAAVQAPVGPAGGAQAGTPEGWLVPGPLLAQAGADRPAPRAPVQPQDAAEREKFLNLVRPTNR